MTVSPGGLPTQNCRGARWRWIAEWQQITFGTGRHSLCRHLTGRRSSQDPSKTVELFHWVDQATPPQLAGRYTYPPNQNIWRFSAQPHVRSAAAPASLAVAATYESATVQTAVPSQARGLPPFQGTSVRPSGRLSSDRTKTCGSLELRISHTGRGEGTSNHIIQCVVLCYFSGSLSTHEAV